MKIHPVLENANPSESIHDPLDAIAAAPKNHKVLYEDDHVRVLEVTVQPGEIENMHHHPCASVFAHDAPMPKFTNSFADDGSVMELGRNLQLISGDPEVPADVVAALAQLNAHLMLQCQTDCRWHGVLRHKAHTRSTTLIPFRCISTGSNSNE